MYQRWAALPLWGRVLIGLLAGIVVGALISFAVDSADPQSSFYKTVVSLRDYAVTPLGELFIRAIKMLIVPLIFVSLVVGVLSMRGSARLGILGVKTIGLYFFNMTIAVSLGLAMANLIGPGKGVVATVTEEVSNVTVKPNIWENLVNLILSIVPTNPVQAMAETQVLPIIFFALLVGFAINSVGDKADMVREWFESAGDVIYKITHWVMETAPLGVFALIATTVATYGVDLSDPENPLVKIIWLVATVYITCLLHMAIISGLHIKLWAGLSLRKFFAGIRDAQLVSFSTCTSSGTLPVTMTCVQENVGVSRGVASFVLPVGATMNMDGTAIYLGATAVFIAQISGIDLTAGQYLTIILVSVLSAIGTAGIPSAGAILAPTVLLAANLPLEYYGMILAVDRVLDMARTSTNVTGDTIVATVVAKTEGQLDESVFKHKPVV